MLGKKCFLYYWLSYGYEQKGLWFDLVKNIEKYKYKEKKLLDHSLTFKNKV